MSHEIIIRYEGRFYSSNYKATPIQFLLTNHILAILRVSRNFHFFPRGHIRFNFQEESSLFLRFLYIDEIVFVATEKTRFACIGLILRHIVCQTAGNIKSQRHRNSYKRL